MSSTRSKSQRQINLLPKVSVDLFESWKIRKIKFTRANLIGDPRLIN